MATANKNLSYYNPNEISCNADLKVGIIYSEWNGNITSKLFQGANDTLIECGIPESQIIVHKVPGAFELPLSADWLLSSKQVDAVIAIGVVIQGETKHFDFVCQGVTQGIMDVSLKHQKPVVFCVLTDNNEQQSIDRAGGVHGNKGIEAAVTCLKMMSLQGEIKKL